MRVRRCAILYLEPREDAAFDLASLLAGGDGLARTRRWVALAPHLGEEVEVDAAERELLGMLGPERWMSAKELPAESRPALRRLLKAGLAIGSTRAHAAHRERFASLVERFSAHAPGAGSCSHASSSNRRVARDDAIDL